MTASLRLGIRYLLCVLFLVAPLSFAHAALNADNTGLSAAARNTGLVNACEGNAQTCIADIVGRLINVALGFIGVLLLVYFLYAGFLWMTAGGDTKKVTEAKDMIKNAVAGLVIIALSFALSSFVLSTLSQSLSPAPAAAPAAIPPAT